MSDDNDDFNSMISLDIYLSSLSDEEYHKVARKIKPAKIFPLVSWDLSGNYLQKTIIEGVNRDADALQLEKLSKKYHWKFDINALLNEKYEAIVVTNSDQQIQWVSEGFTKMTGYDKDDAIGNKPNFLQGKNTSASTRKVIKQHLSAHKPYATRIHNYRKNGEEYLCEVKIIPISNTENVFTHFIAIEREAV